MVSGMEPVSLTIRIPEELHTQLTARAKQEDRTLASLIRVLLAQAVQMPPAEAMLDPAMLKAWAESRQR